ncbi:efflux transporter outer membrane subunit [Sphingosinicella rhizophila]|uniref:Efflux transporter outer membrane subunit n=1 Tax=Sphingosinicella rhizophila TaxID=3050082 RepID=A0ABU3Q7D1_9SPHN|nr:efflux transporter outer membrane subunit [Sphingosinicella sp. GR2756]MDT9598888.1 efflux transporter outer membrane subunit [Sphingosinicella sp. GR2756]
MMRIRSFAALLLLGLSACTTVGPDFASPTAEAPAQAPFLGTASPLFEASEPPGRWWSLFGDARLDALVEEALRANTDLRVAAANLARARAVLREVRSNRLPSTDIAGSVNYGQASGQAQGLDEKLPTGETYDIGLDVGYQLDLFGRIRRAVEAGRADVEAQQAALDVTRISVAAETARAFADVCSAGRQLEVARRSLEVQQRTFDLTRRLLEGGRGTALETGQAGALLEQTRAAIPTLEAQRQTALYRLALLTGRPPASFPREVADCVRPLALAAPIPVGDGAGLLARRPDIRAAERRLAAATARIGVATADLYPDVRIGASIGSTATSIGDLASGSAFRFGIGPLISWSFPNTALARARIAQAEADADAALATFDGTWLGALEETESALARYARERERVATLARAREQSGEAARIARLRYEAGREGFQIVLEAERSLAQTEAALAQAEAQLSTNLIALFLALGGGWST